MERQSSGSIINCRRCGQVFRRRMSAYCEACFREVQDATHRVYNHLQEHYGQTIQEIAKACQVVERDIEVMIYEGGLGTAASSIMVHCYRCSRITPFSRQKGRFCVDCADVVEEGARLDQTLRKEQARQKQPARKSSVQPAREEQNDTEKPVRQDHPEMEEAPCEELPLEVAEESHNHFGFKRHR